MSLSLSLSLSVTGFPCPEHENPADFILDTLTTCERGVANEVAVALDTGRLINPQIYPCIYS